MSPNEGVEEMEEVQEDLRDGIHQTLLSFAIASPIGPCFCSNFAA
jgi:hypothetical protein